MVSSCKNHKALLLLLSLLVSFASAFSPACRPLTTTTTSSCSSSPTLLSLSISSSNDDDDIVMSDKLIEVIDRVRDGITEAGHLEEWNECLAILNDRAGITDQYQAEHYLAQATNWKSWAVTTSPIARKYISPKVPDSTKLQQAMDWILNDLQLPLDLLSTDAIPKAPVAYLVDPAATYQLALAAAPNHYQTADAFRALLLKDPTALQNTYNCASTGCNSECGNCWVSYDMRV